MTCNCECHKPGHSMKHAQPCCGDAGDWRYDVPDADSRRARHIVAVVGHAMHSGMKWHRLAIGVAATVYEGRQGYNAADIAEIERRGDIDAGTGFVVAWTDFSTPPLPLERQGHECALPFPARAALSKATGEGASA